MGCVSSVYIYTGLIITMNWIGVLMDKVISDEDTYIYALVHMADSKKSTTIGRNENVPGAVK